MRRKVRKIGGEMTNDDRLWRLYEHAEKQIARVWKTYAVLGTLLTVLIAVGAFLTYKSISDFRSSISDEVRTEKDIVQRQVEIQIEQEFGRDAIQALITQKAEERIDLVADKLIAAQIEEQITAVRVEFEQGLDDLGVRTADAEVLVAELVATAAGLESSVEMALLVFGAISDSRADFDSLIDIAQDEDHPHSDLAARTVRRIQHTHDWSAMYLGRELQSETGVTTSDILAALADPRSEFRQAALDTIWSREEEGMIPAILELLKEETELTVCAAATRALSKLTGIRSGPLDINFWLRWGEEQN